MTIQMKPTLYLAVYSVHVCFSALLLLFWGGGGGGLIFNWDISGSDAKTRKQKNI